MTLTLRAATPSDVPDIVPLLLADAADRRDRLPALFPLLDNARDAIETALSASLTAENPPFRQQWLLAHSGDKLVGVAHTILLPVPPIYAGHWGPPGLIMPDSVVSADAPTGTRAALITAAEDDLKSAGAQILLAAHLPGDGWEAPLADTDYAPLTLYLTKSDLTGGTNKTRAATDADIPDIVRLSAAHRMHLAELSDFWEPHADADARFANWMRRSLTLDDRDMIVSGPTGDIGGYVIAQPATRLHFPAAHDIDTIGVIDDFHAGDIDHGAGAPISTDLLDAAETALATRGRTTAFVVCPADWTGKVACLSAAGYDIGMVWRLHHPLPRR